ncbi:MAG: DUF4886 domain-containing protein, partial [Bacteroidota bacterium]
MTARSSSFSAAAAMLLFLLGQGLFAQTKREVLFLGNSYTAFNNLPQMVHDVAASVGDTLHHDSHTPGGYTFGAHSTDPTSNAKIMAGGWDYVVLQGQSQESITDPSNFFSRGHALSDKVKDASPCSTVMTYMTWGRKNGNAGLCATFPSTCNYALMDTTIRHSYLTLTEELKAEVAPVSVVWHYLRNNHPDIELYTADGSHPSLAGSYAAACCFYTTIFKKDPTLITFDNGLNAADAEAIRQAAKTEVFDRLSDWDFKEAPAADFWFTKGNGVNQVLFFPVRLAETYLWDFGDGSTSTKTYPNHAYASDG